MLLLIYIYIYRGPGRACSERKGEGEIWEQIERQREEEIKMERYQAGSLVRLKRRDLDLQIDFSFTQLKSHVQATRKSTRESVVVHSTSTYL